MFGKYRNKITVFDGIKFHSKREAEYYQELKLRERAKQIHNLQLQVKYPLIVNGEIVSKYIADFVYIENGKLVIDDLKGVRTAVFNLKWKMMKALFKGKDVIFRLSK